MRLLSYLSQASQKFTNEEQKFRVISIGLVSEKTEHKKDIEKITKSFSLSRNPFDLIDKLNSDLKRYYSGKYKFGFCLEEEASIDMINIQNRERIKKRIFEFNAELDKIKREFELKLKEKNSIG